MLDNFNIGWQVILLGLGTVFFVLLILSVILKSIGPHFGKQQQKPTLGITSAPVQIAAAASENKNAKIAAVMAAIQAIMGDTDYQVVSIKPVNHSFWKQAVNAGPELKFQGRRGK